jgi:hypothetical protein
VLKREVSLSAEEQVVGKREKGIDDPTEEALTEPKWWCAWAVAEALLDNFKDLVSVLRVTLPHLACAARLGPTESDRCTSMHWMPCRISWGGGSGTRRRSRHTKAPLHTSMWELTVLPLAGFESADACFQSTWEHFQLSDAANRKFFRCRRCPPPPPSRDPTLTHRANSLPRECDGCGVDLEDGETLIHYFMEYSSRQAERRVARSAQASPEGQEDPKRLQREALAGPPPPPPSPRHLCSWQMPTPRQARHPGLSG